MQPEKPRLGGIAAVVVFIAVLLAFTIQSDLTTYIQTQLGFKQPYFLLYVLHSETHSTLTSVLLKLCSPQFILIRFPTPSVVFGIYHIPVLSRIPYRPFYCHSSSICLRFPFMESACPHHPNSFHDVSGFDWPRIIVVR